MRITKANRSEICDGFLPCRLYTRALKICVCEQSFNQDDSSLKGWKNKCYFSGDLSVFTSACRRSWPLWIYKSVIRVEMWGLQVGKPKILCSSAVGGNESLRIELHNHFCVFIMGLKLADLCC